jgi:hypothetical protein
MAAPDVSAVAALTNKACDLKHAGHQARALEYEERALAAALALGAEDCLIVAALQVSQTKTSVGMTINQMLERGVAAPLDLTPVLVPFCSSCHAAAPPSRWHAAGRRVPCCRGDVGPPHG